MKSKEFVLDDQLSFIVTKRKSSRHMRISIDSDGTLRVSIPMYVPYTAAIAFVNSRRNWIDKHRPEVKIYTNGMAIGKGHHLSLIPSSQEKIQSRINGNEAKLFYPNNLSPESKEVQLAIKALAVKAHKIQAKNILPIRVDNLANKYDFSYNQLKFRNLKNRWGSCDHQQNITLNISLVELPWELIDYVIVHELNHTKYLNHGQDFWDNFVKVMPNAMELRKEIKKYHARP